MNDIVLREKLTKQLMGQIKNKTHTKKAFQNKGKGDESASTTTNTY